MKRKIESKQNEVVNEEQNYKSKIEKE